MPECLTYSFHRRRGAQPCGRCPACLAVPPPAPFVDPARFAPKPTPEVEPEAEAEDSPEPATAEPKRFGVVAVVAKPGGWHELVDGQGELIEKVRGAEAAEARAAELRGDA